MVSKHPVRDQIDQESPLDAEAYAFDAVIFDMDGVITQTASVHATAWKRAFDAFLQWHAEKNGSAFVAFDHPKDYLAYVDGRPRYRGVETFLASRGIELPFGATDNAPGFETICAVGNKKNEAFTQILEEDGVAVYESTLTLIDGLRKRGIRVGLATSSKNSDMVLTRSGISHLFETTVDGVVSEKLRLKGKPEADIFTLAAFSLGIDPSRAVVVEDAVSGVQAGSRGGFALTIGVAREDNERELLENGADIVVKDLGELTPEAIDTQVKQRSSHV